MGRIVEVGGTSHNKQLKKGTVEERRENGKKRLRVVANVVVVVVSAAVDGFDVNLLGALDPLAADKLRRWFGSGRGSLVTVALLGGGGGGALALVARHLPLYLGLVALSTAPRPALGLRSDTGEGYTTFLAFRSRQ